MGRADWVPGRRVCHTDLPATGTPSAQNQKVTVNLLKHIYLTLLQLTKLVWLLPQAIGNLGKQRRRQAVLNEHEAERLDRIRNPSKYRGK